MKKLSKSEKQKLIDAALVRSLQGLNAQFDRINQMLAEIKERLGITENPAPQASPTH